MAISLRLDKELEQELERSARDEGLTKSQFIRQCLVEHFARQKIANPAWEFGKDLFGQAASGRDDLARDHSRILREKVHARNRTR